MSIILTINGEIKSDRLGLTLPHEHCLLDGMPFWLGEPEELSKKSLFSKPVTLENRGEVIYNSFSFLDNLILRDINNPIKELKEFIGNGGRSLVDLTSLGLGRDPEALRYISNTTGANIIMGAGRFKKELLDQHQRKSSIDDISKEIIKEFNTGIRDSGIKPGIIGEIGIGDISNEIEINSLRGAARAQRKIGCGLNIHPPEGTEGHKILDILDEEKVDLNKVVLSHCDIALDDWQYHDSLAKRGCYIEFDQFGVELIWHVWYGIFLPSDGERIKAIKKQIDLKNLDRILISGDLFTKTCFTDWGGFGYSHIPKHIIPRMKKIGISKDETDRITIENPKFLLTF